MQYVPFLKFKQNEILSLVELEGAVFEQIVPFFDVPRISNMDGAGFKKRIEIAARTLNKHWDVDDPFYLDVFDIDPDLKPDGVCPIEYALNALEAYSIIPTVGIDRDVSHIAAVKDLLESDPDVAVAVRFLPEEFESFELVEDDIEDLLVGILSLENDVDLILDGRFLRAESVESIAQNAATFADKFLEVFSCRNIIITGSSISSISGEIVGTNDEAFIPRNEPRLWRVFNDSFSDDEVRLVFGDYGVVSPEYSDVNLRPELLSSVSVPRALYSLEEQHYAVRGGAFKTHPDGHGQYFDLAKIIVAQKFYRNRGFSSGDEYIWGRSQDIPTSGSPGSWIKNTLNAHLTYIISEL